MRPRSLIPRKSLQFQTKAVTREFRNRAQDMEDALGSSMPQRLQLQSIHRLWRSFYNEISHCRGGTSQNRPFHRMQRDSFGVAVVHGPAIQERTVGSAVIKEANHRQIRISFAGLKRTVPKCSIPGFGNEGSFGQNVSQKCTIVSKEAPFVNRM